MRAVVLLVVVALGAAALARGGTDLGSRVSELSPVALVLALLAVLCGLSASLLAWRAVLADLGSPLPVPAAGRIFFLGQLGKYVPGSVWPLIAQMELARAHHVPRSRSGVVGLLTVAVSLLAGLVIAACTLPFMSADALQRYWWAFLAVPVVGVALLPPVFNGLLDRALRLLRRGGLARPLSARGVAAALAWSTLAWLAFGVQVWLLGRSLGADEASALPLAVGGFALAWVLGFLFVVAPAGAGVREVALVVTLAPVLGRDDAVLVALASRVLMTLGDLLLAAAAVVLSRALRRGVELALAHRDEPLHNRAGDASSG